MLRFFIASRLVRGRDLFFEMAWSKIRKCLDENIMVNAAMGNLKVKKFEPREEATQ